MRGSSGRLLSGAASCSGSRSGTTFENSFANGPKILRMRPKLLRRPAITALRNGSAARAAFSASSRLIRRGFLRFVSQDFLAKFQLLDQPLDFPDADMPAHDQAEIGILR